MKTILMTTILITITFNCFVSSGADWKYWANAIINDERMTSYYDIESIRHISNGDIRVWTRSIKSSELSSSLKNLNGDQLQIIKEWCQKKLSTNYQTPLSTIDPSHATTKDTILSEGIIKFINSNSEIKVLWEINCVEKKVRTLSMIRPDGRTIAQDDNPSEWSYIAPETSMELLRRFLCSYEK